RAVCVCSPWKLTPVMLDLTSKLRFSEELTAHRSPHSSPWQSAGCLHHAHVGGGCPVEQRLGFVPHGLGTVVWPPGLYSTGTPMPAISVASTRTAARPAWSCNSARATVNRLPL